MEIQGVALFLCIDRHQGIGWSSVNKWYNFCLQEIFRTADPFPGTNCRQLRREILFWRGKNTRGGGVVNVNEHGKMQCQFSQISLVGLISVGR